MSEQAFKIPKTGLRIQHVDGNGSTLLISGTTLPDPSSYEEGTIFLNQTDGSTSIVSGEDWEPATGGGGGVSGFAKALWTPTEIGVPPVQTAATMVASLSDPEITITSTTISDVIGISTLPTMTAFVGKSNDIVVDSTKKVVYFTFDKEALSSSDSGIYFGFSNDLTLPLTGAPTDAAIFLMTYDTGSLSFGYLFADLVDGYPVDLETAGFATGDVLAFTIMDGTTAGTVDVEMHLWNGVSYDLVASQTLAATAANLVKNFTFFSSSNTQPTVTIIKDVVGYGAAELAGASQLQMTSAPTGIVNPDSFPANRANFVYRVTGLAYSLISDVGLISNNDYVVFDADENLAGRFVFDDYRFIEQEEWTPTEIVSPSAPLKLIQYDLFGGALSSSDYYIESSGPTTVFSYSEDAITHDSTKRGTYFKFDMAQLQGSGYEFVNFGYSSQQSPPYETMGIAIERDPNNYPATQGYIDIGSSWGNLYSWNQVNMGGFSLTITINDMFGGFTLSHYESGGGMAMMTWAQLANVLQGQIDLLGAPYTVSIIDYVALRITPTDFGDTNIQLSYWYGTAPFSYPSITQGQDEQEPINPPQIKIGNVGPGETDYTIITGVNFSTTDELCIAIDTTGGYGTTYLYKNGLLVGSHTHAVLDYPITRMGIFHNTSSPTVRTSVVPAPLAGNIVSGVTQHLTAPGLTGNADMTVLPANPNEKAFLVSGMAYPLSTPVGQIRNDDIAIFSNTGTLRKILGSGGGSEPVVFYYVPSSNAVITDTDDSYYLNSSTEITQNISTAQAPDSTLWGDWHILSVEPQIKISGYWFDPNWIAFDGSAAYGVNAYVDDANIKVFSGYSGLTYYNPYIQGSAVNTYIYGAAYRLKVTAIRKAV